MATIKENLQDADLSKLLIVASNCSNLVMNMVMNMMEFVKVDHRFAHDYSLGAVHILRNTNLGSQETPAPCNIVINFDNPPM